LVHTLKEFRDAAAAGPRAAGSAGAAGAAGMGAVSPSSLLHHCFHDDTIGKLHFSPSAITVFTNSEATRVVKNKRVLY